MQHHELIWTQTQRLISASIAIAEFDLERSAVLQHFNHSTHLTAREIVLRHISRERHHVKEFDFISHSNPTFS